VLVLIPALIEALIVVSVAVDLIEASTEAVLTRADFHVIAALTAVSDLTEALV